MTCHHSAGDPNCTSNRPSSYYDAPDPDPKTPDANNYEIIDIARVGPHVVVKVLYPNCRRCAYEGNKIMVFLDAPETQIVRWRKIDPHFRSTIVDPKEAPSPAARFPASAEGWKDALEYARTKMKT